MYSSSATAVHFILMNFINRTFIALVFYSTSGTSNRSDYGDQIKPEFYVTFLEMFGYTTEAISFEKSRVWTASK